MCNKLDSKLWVLQPKKKKLAALFVAKTGPNVGGNMRTSLFKLFYSNVAKQVARVLLPVLPQLYVRCALMILSAYHISMKCSLLC